jgi:hypothetical protein
VQLDAHTAVPDWQTLAVAEQILCGRQADVLVTFELLREGYEMIGRRLSTEVAGLRGWLKQVPCDTRPASAVA